LAVRALGHDAFKALRLCFLKELCSRRFSVPAESNELMARQDGFEPRFAFEQGKTAQILAVMEIKSNAR
jgi:hypothetical protein